MKKILSMLCALSLVLSAEAQPRQVKITLLETSDVHGNYLPHDFIGGQPGKGSLARVATYVKKLRRDQGEQTVILLDNGDILQGQPTAYYYNYIDTTSVHLCAQVLNYMCYDAATIGNHDIETGHAVYDRWTRQCHFPVLGANVIDTQSNSPYWKPYTLIERQGVRIAILGMITPAVPNWLPENLWSGLRFEDQVEIARKYMPEMRMNADVVVGLMHSGTGSKENASAFAEHAALQVAQRVPGFDVLFCGHDHRRANRTLLNDEGKSVVVLDPAADAQMVAQADITLTIDNSSVIDKKVRGTLVDVGILEPDVDFLKMFANQYQEVKDFTSKRIGVSDTDMETYPAFFGSSAFVDFIHQMQLEISGADISFAAPLSFDARIAKGPIEVRHLFSLYRYENMLYVMKLTGQEIKDYLEYSYDKWTRQMSSSRDTMLCFRHNPEQISEAWMRLSVPCFNFDSAAGIRYTVDVRKPAGEKITICSMADGRPFSLTTTYRCAFNSYRGNGGGGLLTKGAGIAPEELNKRIIWSTDRDLRYYLLERISQQHHISPKPLNHWQFIPADWIEQAKQREIPLLRP